MSELVAALRRLVASAFLAPIRAYRRFLSPLLPRRCRFEPTCSAYAEQAITELGPARGALVAAWRVVRCNPMCTAGHDPLEERRFFRSAGVDAAPPLGDHSHSRGVAS